MYRYQTPIRQSQEARGCPADTKCYDNIIYTQMGEIYMETRWHERSQMKLVQKGKESMKSFNFLGKGYTYEIEEVNHCLRNKLLESPKWTMKNSLEMASLMDEIRSQVGVSFPGEKTTSN